MKTCLNCAKQNFHNSRFCVACGQKFTEGGLPNKAILSLAVGCVFIIGAALFLKFTVLKQSVARASELTFEESCFQNGIPREVCENMSNGLTNYFPSIRKPRSEKVKWERKQGCLLKNGKRVAIHEATFYEGEQKIEAEFDETGNLIEHEFEFVSRDRFPEEVLAAFEKDFPNTPILEYEIDKMTDGTVHYEFEVDGAKDKDITYEMKNGRAKRVQRNWCED